MHYGVSHKLSIEEEHMKILEWILAPILVS